MPDQFVDLFRKTTSGLQDELGLSFERKSDTCAYLSNASILLSFSVNVQRGNELYVDAHFLWDENLREDGPFDLAAILEQLYNYTSGPPYLDGDVFSKKNLNMIDGLVALLLGPAREVTTGREGLADKIRSLIVYK